MNERNALIIGAGPAGLTAAFELLKRSRHAAVVLEKSDEIGGIPARSVQRQPDGYRWASVLFKVRPGHELVDGSDAGGGSAEGWRTTSPISARAAK